MKKIIKKNALTNVSAFTPNNTNIYKKCAACHGTKAEKKYLNKVPALVDIDPAQRLADMKAYKAGTLNGGKGKNGMGAIMKGQMAALSDADMEAVNNYISTLK